MKPTAVVHQSIATARVDVTTDNIFDLVNAGLTLQETGGLLTADGSEQTLYISNAPLGTYRPVVMFIDLDNMEQGETIEVRVYYRITTGGGLQLQYYSTHTGVDGGLGNGKKLLAIDLYPNRFGCQVTLEQTADTYRTFRWGIFVEN